MSQVRHDGGASLSNSLLAQAPPPSRRLERTRTLTLVLLTASFQERGLAALISYRDSHPHPHHHHGYHNRPLRCKLRLCWGPNQLDFHICTKLGQIIRCHTTKSLLSAPPSLRTAPATWMLKPLSRSSLQAASRSAQMGARETEVERDCVFLTEDQAVVSKQQHGASATAQRWKPLPANLTV